MNRITGLGLVILINILIFETIAISCFNLNESQSEAAWASGDWSKLPGVRHEVPPESVSQPAPMPDLVDAYRALNYKFAATPGFPLQPFWKIAAKGLSYQQQGALAIPTLSKAAAVKTETQNIKPESTSFFPETTPAPDKPFLTWTSIPGAVYYEIELLSEPPENPNGTEPSLYRIFSSREVFVNGYNPDLSMYPKNSLYWRVRALDYDGNGLGVFSDAQQIFIDHTKQIPLKPQIIADLKSGSPLLYPVYAWIPISGAASYEVEILSAPPENPNGTGPSIYRIGIKKATGFDCYDDEAIVIPGIYYWRVRGLDANGAPVGVFSDTGQFEVDFTKGNYAATFGDSITHGGGAISYPPSSAEYCFQTYLNFPVMNIGKSGDTSETMVKRFDRDVLPYHPKYLIILGGTNSLRGDIPVSRVIGDLIAIRDKCLAQGIRPIFLTLPPINPGAIMRAFHEETSPDWRQKFDIVNSFIKQQQYYIDLEPYLSDNNRELPGYYAIDGLHPDIEGKKVIARIINDCWSTVTQ